MPDVIVVGAGVVGLSVAFHLQELGASVVVVERSGVGAGASGVQPGGVRQQWGTRVNCLLAQESMAFWRDVRERLNMRVDPAVSPNATISVFESKGDRVTVIWTEGLQSLPSDYAAK